MGEKEGSADKMNHEKDKGVFQGGILTTRF